MPRLGDRSRCMRCGGKIVLISDPRVISLTAAVWVHESAVRRFVGSHAPVPPSC
jgi:hypothetical protein